ncbi:MAG: hypothetical protein GXP48_09595 [Acidobacteria bacterium]|nr:hypothetical protein [Acidobacteriota bacterium]
MNNGAIGSVEQLVDGILAGTVARQVRLFAAQGLLPISHEDVFRLQLILSADPDPELADLARASVVQEGVAFILEWLEDPHKASIELDILIRIRNEEEVWAAVAQHAGVADETLRVLARHGSALVQDIIVTNQVRLLSCLELLEDLRANPQINNVVLRRVKEFEDEFIVKAAAAAPEATEIEPSPSIEEALTALRALGSHLPNTQDLPLPPTPDEELAERAEKKGEGAFARLLRMSTHEKVIRALKGSQEERSILVNSRNRIVVRAVLASPKLTDGEVERFASLRSASEEVTRLIAQNPRWIRRYPIIHSLVENPKTPIQIALRLLPRLNIRHLKKMSMNRNIDSAVRKRALQLLAQRR